jgi:MYXO-CTERM domain-containing protein
VSLTGDGTKGPNDHTPMLPNHNNDGSNQPAPLGSGIALLTALGAGYVVAKRRRE